jgi:hypothetical protein
MIFYEYDPVPESALKILLDCGVDRLPINTKYIAKKIGIMVVPYSKAGDALSCCGRVADARGSDGIALRTPTGAVICYNDALPPELSRVIIGHEMGHLVLRHIGCGAASVCHYPFSDGGDPGDFAANLFCEQIIAPSCILSTFPKLDRATVESKCELAHIATDFILARTLERGNYEPSTPEELALLKAFGL